MKIHIKYIELHGNADMENLWDLVYSHEDQMVSFDHIDFANHTQCEAIISYEIGGTMNEIEIDQFQRFICNQVILNNTDDLFYHEENKLMYYDFVATMEDQEIEDDYIHMDGLGIIGYDEMGYKEVMTHSGPYGTEYIDEVPYHEEGLTLDDVSIKFDIDNDKLTHYIRSHAKDVYHA